MNIQFKKGALDMCVLSMLEKEDRYGYDIANTLSSIIDIADGTVYPILRKLKQDECLQSYLKEASGGPPRKYYTITQKGLDNLAIMKSEWKDFIIAVNNIMNQEN